MASRSAGIAGHEAVIAAVGAALAGDAPVPRDAMAEAVRALAGELRLRHGGRTIEVRVPPFAAVQLAGAAGAGPHHTRGTPPNVVETDPATFVRLATGLLTWTQAQATGVLRCSGSHAHETASYLPLAPLTAPVFAASEHAGDAIPSSDPVT
ncbi:MAG: sterol carrier family protein [Actinomycetia bacterium]|nr:sterol carrier family protein [Actinomycetes bacterium]